LTIAAYQDCIEKCKDCSNDVLRSYISEDNGIFKKPRCFWTKESELSVVLIGHLPYLKDSVAEYVLKMNLPNERLYKYIKNEILDKLKIKIDNVYFTNLLKCLTNKPATGDNKIPTAVYNNMCSNCKKHLENEISIIDPKLIISLSGKVLKFSSKNYYKNTVSKKRVLRMPSSCANLFRLSINEKEYYYIPVNHSLDDPKLIRHKKFYFPMQTERLKELSKELKTLSLS
jgi:uracil-DNA glycosylase